MKMGIKRRARSRDANTLPPVLPRLVSQPPQVALVSLVRRGSTGWWVSWGGEEQELEADSTLDPALLEDALARHARVVVDASVAPPVIAGLLMTQRTIVVDAAGGVDAELQHFRVTAREDAMLRTDRAFVRLTSAGVEMLGNRIVVRAREVAKILGRLVKLN